MVDVHRRETLAVECAIFTRYLLGADAPADVVAAYQRAHDVSRVEASGAPPSLDRALLRVACCGPGFTQAADAYAALFAKASLLRRKLVLLVAILESRGHSAAALDTAVPGSRAIWIIGIGARAAGCAARAAVVALVLVPLRAWYRARRVGSQ